MASEPVVREIRAELKVSFGSMLSAKLHRWVRRNLWLYLLAAAGLSVGYATLQDEAVVAVYFQFVPLVLGLSFTAMVGSALLQARTKRHLACRLVLRPDGIRVEDAVGARTVSWDWVAPVTETATQFVLCRAGDPKNVLMLRKGGPSLPTEEHSAALRRWAGLCGR